MESNEFRIDFYRIFRTFFALSNQSNRTFSNRIDQISNKFQFDSTPNLSLCSTVASILIALQVQDLRILTLTA